MARKWGGPAPRTSRKCLAGFFRPRRQRACFDFLFQFVPNLFEDLPGGSGTQYSLDVL